MLQDASQMKQDVLSAMHFIGEAWGRNAPRCFTYEDRCVVCNAVKRILETKNDYYNQELLCEVCFLN
jgi:hypothetical protein